MDPENQGQVKTIAERAQKDNVPKSDIIVVLGASDFDGVMISAETVLAEIQLFLDHWQESRWDSRFIISWNLMFGQ